MNDLLALLIISILCIGLVLQELRYRRLKSSFRKQTKAFQDLISNFNHRGPIPHAATLLGLMKLTSREIVNCIYSYQERSEKGDSNTSDITRELAGIVTTNMRLMRQKIDAYLSSRRETLKYFEPYQNSQ